MPAEHCKAVWRVIIRTFLILSGEKGRGIEEWLLVRLIYSLSLFYLIQMKMQLLFFSSQENFLKTGGWLWAHILISPKCFRSGFREKNALGN